MSYKLDRVVIIIFQIVISIVSALLLSCLICTVPLLKFFTYVAEYSIGMGVNPLISSTLFFSTIFILYSIISRTCRLGPLVCTIMCIVVLVLNSPLIYLIVSKLSYIAPHVASTLGTLVYGFHVPLRDLLYISILCAASTLIMIISRVVENIYAIGELTYLKRVPIAGSLSNILVTSSLVVICLAFIVSGSILSLSRVNVGPVPVGLSLLSIGVLSLLIMLLLLFKGRV